MLCLVIICISIPMAADSTVQVVSYNVLSSALSTQSFYPHNAPEDLDSNARYERLLSKLEGVCSQGSILCLQEVSRAWADELAIFFRSVHYDYQLAESGNEYNNYMGVLTAWPTQRFELIRVQSTRLTEAREWQWGSKEPPKGFWDMSWGEVVTSLLPQPFRQRKRTQPRLMDEVRKKYQRLLCVCLGDKQATKYLAIANYHAPCWYWDDAFNIVQACMVARTVQRFAKHCTRAPQVPVVLAGDFNITPKSPAYKVFTDGNEMSCTLLSSIEPDVREAWKSFRIGACFDSAYASVNGAEPQCTTKAWNAKSPEPFCDTLDYIFCGYGAEATEVMALPAAADVDIMPNAAQPSDHMMIGATILF